MEELRELNSAVVVLEEQMRRFERNCVRLDEYQRHMLAVAHVLSRMLEPPNADRTDQALQAAIEATRNENLMKDGDVVMNDS